uniref:Pancreatic lipase-related protein 2-like n=1 Tax=Phallusia mammillata TaxID=59560 RepID=A0A6F9DPB7_9ASCI|nr:pancreatic lipase-related protein 2-like [Phallusia mammillata]
MKRGTYHNFDTYSVTQIKTSVKLLLFYLAIAFHTEKTSGLRHKHSAGNENKQTVCYQHLGCFSILPPFSPKMPLPMSPKQIQTKYHLFTRSNPEEGQLIEPESQNLTNSYFDSAKPTKILVHGYAFIEARLAKWVPEVTAAILYKEDVNVIQVNWVIGAHVAYDNAVSNTRVVGAQVAHLIKTLMANHGAHAEDFHLIGFSLGAHVTGFAGKKVQESGKRYKVGRITGLDPANPGFNHDNASVRLDKTDAKFVDVIHTDTSTLFGMANGLNRNLGHIDFYPNGGADQTGCHDGSKHWIKAVTDMTMCDHLRAPMLFKHSINATGPENEMDGYKCDSFEKFKRGTCLRCRGRGGKHKGGNRCRQMGYWATPLRGKQNQVQYYLVTSGQAPFTVKHYQVQIHWWNHTDASPSGFKAKLFLTLHGENDTSKEIALNDGTTFHVVAGQTTRFLITQDSEQDVGQIERITFRWEQPSCWNFFFNCHRENVRLKRIKIFDAAEQRRYLYTPLSRSSKSRYLTQEVQPDIPFELIRRPYKESKPIRYLVHPAIVDPNSKSHTTKLGSSSDSASSKSSSEDV